MRSVIAGRLFVQEDAINTDCAVFGIPVDTFHAVVTDFFRIEITAVAFAASDTIPVI